MHHFIFVTRIGTAVGRHAGNIVQNKSLQCLKSFMFLSLHITGLQFGLCGRSYIAMEGALFAFSDTEDAMKPFQLYSKINFILHQF